MAVPAHAEVCPGLLIPVPDKLMVLGELVALLVTEMLPLKAPVVVGLKTTLKAAFAPEVKVRGKESPLVLKPAPATVIWDTVTLLVPVFVSVTGRMLLLPTLTLPKLVLRGLAERKSAVLVPVPDSVSIVGELVALLPTATLPLKVPAVAGVKTTLKTAFAPDVRVRGRESPLVLKPVPATLTCDSVTLPVPVLVRVAI